MLRFAYRVDLLNALSRRHFLKTSVAAVILAATPLGSAAIRPASAEPLSMIMATLSVRCVSVQTALFVAELYKVVFTLREQDDATLVRPIGARDMHPREAKRYDEESVRVQG